MSSRFRTIDNLGVDPSIRYAEDQEKLGSNYADESFIFSNAEVDVSSPSYLDELEALFQTRQKNLSWAAFYFPKLLSKRKRNLFTHVLFPFITQQQSFEAYRDKILKRLRKRSDFFKKRKFERQKKGLPQDFDEEIDHDAANKESHSLIELFNLIHFLDKVLVELVSRRDQYKKG